MHRRVDLPDVGAHDGVEVHPERHRVQLLALVQLVQEHLQHACATLLIHDEHNETRDYRLFYGNFTHNKPQSQRTPVHVNHGYKHRNTMATDR